MTSLSLYLPNNNDLKHLTKTLLNAEYVKIDKNMNKNLKEDLSKVFTYHVDRWYNNEGNEEDINFKRVKTNLSNKADVYNQRNNQRNIN